MWEILEAFHDDILDTAFHGLFQVIKPLLNFTVVLIWTNNAYKLNLFVFLAHNLSDLIFLQFRVSMLVQSMESHFIDALETLFEMFLDATRLLRVSQNFNQILVGQEEETRKEVSLGF